MRCPTEMDAPSVRFFFLFDTIPGCLGLHVFIRRLTDLIDFCLFQCNLKSKLNYENKFCAR